MIHYHSNLQFGINATPAKNDSFEYSVEILSDIIEIISERGNYNFEFPADFKKHFIDKIDLIFEQLYQLDPNKILWEKKQFVNFMTIDNNYNEIISMTTPAVQTEFKENYHALILYYSNLISNNHNNIARYPKLDFNPL